MTRLSSDEQWEHWRGEIEKLGKIVARLANDFNAIHIETQRFLTKLPVKSHQHWIWMESPRCQRS